MAGRELISVAAAASLRDGMEEIARNYEAQTKEHVELTFGSSGQLMAQIKAGAPVDAFVSAAEAQVKELAKAGLVDQQSRKVIAGNELVVIVPAKSPEDITSFEDLAKAKKVAIGEPGSVPAGTYAQQVLRKLSLSEKMKNHIVYGTNVRQVLDYVRRGEVSAGIVYATDAKEAGEEVTVVAKAEPSWHEPIVYPSVIVTRSDKRDAAKRFLEYLAGDQAQRVLKAKGFAPALAPTSAPAPAPASKSQGTKGT